MGLPRVDDLLRRILIQCVPGQAATAADIAAAHHSGLVITGPKPRTTVRHLRERGFTGPILCDADRYSGRRRLLAGAGLRRSWTAEQHDLGLIALTDSGHLAAGDWPGLRRLLDDAATHPPPVLVMLPLAAPWFAVHTWVDRLVTVLDDARLPVAVTIEHAGDPFSTRYVLDGFVRLLTASVPVLLLRSGVSALGAACHGAHAGAVGGGRQLPFVPALLGHFRQALVERVVAETPHLGRQWRCACPECGNGRPIGFTDDNAVFRHSLHAQLALGGLLLHPRHDAPDTVRSWHERCAHALDLHQDVAEVVPRWHPPPVLRRWFEVTVPTVGGTVPRQNLDEDAPRATPLFGRRGP